MTLDVYRFAIPSHAPSSARRQKAQPASEGTRVRRHQRAVDEPAAVPLCVRSTNGSRSDCLKASFAHRTDPPRQYEVPALFTGGLSNKEGGRESAGASGTASRASDVEARGAQRG